VTNPPPFADTLGVLAIRAVDGDPLAGVRVIASLVAVMMGGRLAVDRRS